MNRKSTFVMVDVRRSNGFVVKKFVNKWVGTQIVHKELDPLYIYVRTECYVYENGT